MGDQWNFDVQKTELETYAECFGFFKAFSNADDVAPLWLTSYGREISLSIDIPFGGTNLGGSYVAYPAGITRGAITRTMDPRDTQVEVTLEGLAGSQQFLLKQVNNNYIVVIVWQHITAPEANQVLIVGEGVPTMYDGDGVSIIIREDRRILDRLLPDVVYQKMCNNILFGRRCGLLWQNYSLQLQWGDFQNVTMSDYWAGHTHWELTHPSIGAFGETYFYGGSIVIGDWNTSRDRRMINWQAGDQIAIAPAFDRKIYDDERVIIAPGCDKSITTCSTKFANMNNFFGFPELPTKNPATQGMF